ncbi:hypothetical protein LCGC14_0377710 [marine sediment metagenome]|uniref:Uncharacterized protein n=1 Tax=marine sediment metagenome TaxID=412755 RepID=A0A0F9T8Y8_9ZZZZ
MSDTLMIKTVCIFFWLAITPAFVYRIAIGELKEMMLPSLALSLFATTFIALQWLI